MLYLPSFITKPVGWLDRKIMNWADVVILVDKAREKQIYPAKPKKLIFIYNVPEIEDVFLKKIKKISSKKDFFFYAGLLSKDRMIKEIIALFKKHPSWKLEIAGWGPLEGFVKKAAKYENIKFLGRISYEEVLEKTAQTRFCFAFYDPRVPNNRYASPNKLFEAMALGKPIITNKGTSMTELVEREKMGLVIKYGKVDDFQRAISFLLKHPSLCQKIGQRNYQLYKKEYHWSNMKKRLLRVIQNLMVI